MYLTHRRPTGLPALILTLALLLVPLLGIISTPQAHAQNNCTTSGATITCTFSYTGAPATWTVPADVTQARFQLVGAPGGLSDTEFPRSPGGMGARVDATLPLTPGSIVTVVVGGPGTEDSFGGFNGGGDGLGGEPGSRFRNGGGGGGASDVRLGGADLADRVLVAGGGGGAGDGVFFLYGGGNGGNADADGGDGSGAEAGGGGASGNTGGQGGTAVATVDPGTPGGNGALGQGGVGGTVDYAGSATAGGGGGGGGGYFGGGGGGGGGGKAQGAPSSGGGGGGGSSFVTSEATNVTIATDNSATPQVIISYSMDGTAPIASPTQATAANANGWNNSNVTVSWNWSDEIGGSGIDSANCTTSSTSSGEGMLTLSAACADLSGNVGSASYSVKVDTTAPTISAAAGSNPNAAGWYNADVTVAFSCADTLSGVASCPPSQTLTGEDSAISSTAQSVSDRAGNTSAPSNIVTVQIDRTAPVVSVTGVSDGATYSLGAAPTAACSTSDALSGVATQATLSLSGSGVGSYTATCAGATDSAGNSAPAVSVSYRVAYSFSGFSGPVENPPVVNQANAGRSIPLKWRVIDASGNPITNLTSVSVTSVAGGCTAGAPSDTVEEYANATSGLQNLGNGYYQFNWKTERSWAGTCRTLRLNLGDGQVHTALFQFR